MIQYIYKQRDKSTLQNSKYFCTFVLLLRLKLTRLIRCFLGSHNARVKAINLLKFPEEERFNGYSTRIQNGVKWTGRDTLHDSFIPC